jgi:hypothetical protein
MNSDLIRIWKHTDIVCLKEIARNSLGDAEEIQEKGL